MNDSLLWYTTRGAGLVSLLLLTFVVVLGVLSVRRFEAPGWPRFLTAGLHANASLIAVIFLSIHVATAIVDPFTHLGLGAALIPFSSYYRTFWLGLGTIAAELVAAIVLTSLVRHSLGHGAWRAVHWLAYLSWPIAVLHGWGTGTDGQTAWVLVLDAVCVLAVGAAAGYRLLAGPPDPMAPARAGFRARVRRDVVP